MRGQTTRVPHRGHPWRGHPGRPFLSPLQRRQLDAPGAVRPSPSDAIEEIAILTLRQPLQGYCPSRGIADEALQLITAMGRNLGVGAQGKAMRLRRLVVR